MGLFSKFSRAKSASAEKYYVDAEIIANEAVNAANKGNSYLANEKGVAVVKSLISDPTQFLKIQNSGTMALALGKMMEGDNFSDSEEIVQAVGITYYFICRAIKEGNISSPYIYVYKFSTEYEYNKAMYRLMAHADGKEYRNNPFDMFSQISIITYDHNLEGMMMADVFTEPKITYLDTALNNIFNDIYSKYRGSDKEKVKTLAKGYTDKVYEYLCSKINSQQFDF